LTDSQRLRAQSPATSDSRDAGPVWFTGDYRLEGILEWPESEEVRGGVVVAHPHPLHGGTMAQPVVYRCAQAGREAGFATLRFNFRGVGRSAGTYSGRDEYRDVEAAAAYLRDRLDTFAEPGLEGRLPLALAGYSFGSVMAAVSAVTVMPDVLVLIGFAVESELFPKAALERLRTFPNPILAVCGESDDLAPPAVVQSALEKLGVDFRLMVIRDTGHFFEGRQREVGEAVASFIAESLQ
jgi:alpha/beta superfamily hydrolase